MAPDKIDDLYDALKADGAVQKSKENFRNYMLAPGDEGVANRKALYEALKADGAVTSPTQEEFEKRLDIAGAMGNASSETNGGNSIVNTVQDVASKAAAAMKPKSSSNSNDETLVGDVVATAKDAAAIASGAPHIVVDGQHGAWNVIHNGTGNTNGGRPDLLESLNAYGNLLLLPQQKRQGEQDETTMPGSTGGGLPSGGTQLRKADYTDKDMEEDIKLMHEYLGNDLVDENGNVISAGAKVSSRYKPNTVYYGQTRAYKEGLLPAANLQKYFRQAAERGNEADWETKDRSGMNYQELVKERQALAGKYPSDIAQANDDVLRDAYELRNIDLEIIARDLGYKSANEMNSHPGKRDAALIGPDLNQQWLDYYKNYGSTVTEHGVNPLYVDGWDKLADMVETDQKNGVTRGVDDYIQALFNNNPGLEDKFYAWCMECASRGDVSFNGTVEAALEDYRKSIMAGENRWKLAGDDKKQAVKDVNEQLDEMDAGYEEDLEAWQKRFDEWWDKNGSPFEHHPQELYAAATGDNALTVTRAAQHISSDTREMANEALKTKDFMSASVRGIWNKVSDIRNWDLGITELKDNLTIMNVLDKVAERKQLSDSEQKLMDALALKQMTAGFFKDYISLGYKTGQVTGEALPFMLQMMSGIGAAGKGAAKGSTKWIAGIVARWAEKYITNKGLPKLFTKAAEKVLGRKFTGVVSKVVNSGTAKKIGKAVGTIADEAIGTAAGGTALAVSVGAPATAAEAVSNMTRDTKVAMGSDGKPMLIVSKDKKNAGEAIRNAVINQGIQYGTEMAGEYFKPITDFFGKYIGKGLSKNKIGREILDFVSNMKGSDFAKMVDHFRKEAHYDGTLGEYLEEVLGNFSNAVLVGDMNFNAPSDENSVFNVKNNWETYVGCLYMSGLFGAANLAGYRSPKFRANESLKHADKNARRIFGKEWSTIADIINTGNDEDVQNFMVDLMQSGKYNRYQKQAALDYAGAHYKLRGVEEGETRSELSAGDQEASEAYGRGYNMGNLENIAETSSAYQQLRAQMEEEYGAEFVSKMDEKPGTVYGWLRSGEVKEEDAQKVLDYLNAKMAYEGAVDRINDDQAAAEAASDKHIDDRVNPEKDGGDGMIHPVVLKSGDKQVYVTNGQVVTNEDGTVDTKASTQSIVVVDEEGNVDMINPDAIDHVEDVIDPEQAKQAAREEMAATTQAVAEPEVDEMEDENATEEGEEEDVESGTVSNYDNVLDAMGIEGEEDRQAWNDYWAENAPEDAMDVLLDAQGVTDPAQRQRSKEYWQQNPRTFNSQWRYTMGDISSQAVNDAIAQGGTSESEADARNTQTPTATAQPQPQQASPSIAATSLGDYEQDDDVVLNVDGQQITGFISNVTPDGKLRLQLDVPINGNRVIDVTPEELDKMVAQPQASGEGDAALTTPQTEQPAAPAAPQPAQPGAASQPSLPVGEDGNADFSNATPQEAHDYIYNDPDLDEDEADQVVQNYAAQANEQLAQAQVALDQAEAVPAPVMADYGTDVAGYKRAKKERNDAIANAQAAVDAAQRGVNLWNGVQDMRNTNAPAQETAPDAVPADTGNTQTPPTPASTPSAQEGGETRMSSTENRQEQPTAAERSEEEMTADERIEQAIKERIKTRAKEIAEACGMPSHVIEDIDDPSLPDSYRRKIKELEQKGEMVEGWYDTDTGHMYFYLPGIPNLDRLDEIYAHETVAHGGLRLLLRGKDGSDEEFNKLCDNVWSKMSVEARAERMLYVVAKHISPEDWKDAKKRNQALKEGLQNQQYQREAADEYMAKLSEIYEQQKRNKKERGRIMQIIDAIRDAIKKHFKKEGVKLNINIEKTKDILNLLDKSRRKLTEMDAVAVSNQIDNALSNGEGESDAANGMFSTTSIFEGAGFEVQQIDAEGNSVPMVDSKGNMIVKIGDQEFSAERPVTVEDLKPKKMAHTVEETSVLQMLVEDAKKVNGLSEKKADKIYQNYADILNMYLYMGSAEMGGPDAVERNWEWLGDTVFRTIAANGDDQYSYSMDIIRVCKKNEAVIKAMSAHQLLSGRGATPSEIVDIYRKTYVEGFQVPCPVCYVFTRYIRNGKYASAAIRGMETYGEHLPGGNDVWTAKQWADELDRLNRLTNSKYEVKGKETEAQKEKRVAEAKRFEKALEKANEITVKYEKRLNALSVVLTSPGLTAEREQKILDEIKVMDAQYQGAIDVISYQALTNWIKTHAIEEKKGSGWKLRDDAQKPADINDYKANALDLRKTANTIVNYPAIQRLRKSGGSAAGKEISFASNNELGEVVSGLGINKTNLSTYANPYQMALNTDLDQKKRKEWRRKARDRFKDASTYAAMQTLRGGQRMWSWSDNIERLSPDVAINLIQLELLNGAMQTYSKQLEGVKLAAQMGAYVNGSLMAKDNGWLEVEQDDVMERDGQLWLNHDISDVVDEPQLGGGTEPRERVIAGVGSHVYQAEDGKMYVLQFDDIIGIDPYGNRKITGKDGKEKKAKGLFELNNELDKAGNILVGMNDLHIRAALADPRVFFVIPWHSSGANNHILAEMFAILEQRIDNSVDYTDMQEEKNMGTRNKDTKELPEVIQKLRDLWEEGRQWAEENGWASGMEVDSNGDVMTESQYMYRQLRSLIFSGEIFKKMPTNAEYKKAVADAKAYNARLDEIQADLDRGGLTAEQKKALEKERDKIRPKRNEAQEIVDRHDGLIDWRDSAVHKDDAAWNAEHPKRINVEEARKMILADEFLKQVYNRVKPIGKMTNGDNTYIYPYEYWDESSTYDGRDGTMPADINGKRYVEYCRRMGYKPKFAGNWKTKDVSKQSEGDFVHDPGYWKLLIDRRMYDREGNYQWLDPVTSEDFNTDLINPMETQHEFHVTTVADDAAADSIASKVFEEESKTPGGFAHANYDKPLDKVVDDFEKAMEPGMMFSFSPTKKDFDTTRDRAVQEIGIVTPGLGEKEFNIVDVPRHDFTGTGNQAIMKARKWAEEKLYGEHTAHKGTEEEYKYEIDEDSVDKFLSSSSTTNSENLGVHLAVLKKLLKIIDNCVDAEIHPDYKKIGKVRSPENGIDDENLLIHRMYGAIEIDDEVRRVKITMEEHRDKDNHMYDYRVTKIDLPISGSATTNALGKPIILGANLLQGIEKSYDPGKNLLAESEKNSKTTENGENMLMSTSPTFYSNAERAVENIKQNKATAEQWLAMIKKNGGLKTGEDKWMGLSQWLEDNKGKSLTKDEVLQFVRDNGIQMEEVEYGELEKTPRFQELNAEYLDILNNLQSVYDKAAKQFADYYRSMEEKYGEDFSIENLTPQEQMTYKRLERDQEEVDIYVNDPRDIAMREMVDRYGDDFEMAFYGDHGGLWVSDSGYAGSFLDMEGINSTRLDYTTKGLDNKREIAFKVPSIEPYQEYDEVHFGPENQGKAVLWVRFGETTDADGKRVLVIDEIQSNRHQDAREKGYKTGDAITELEKLKDEANKAQEAYDNHVKELEKRYGESFVNLYADLSDAARAKVDGLEQAVYDASDAYEKYSNSVPAAPFEKNWHEVAMKRMLRLAAEEGFDKVAWTTGEQQAKRYSLGRMFNSIEREDNPNLRDTKRFVLSGSNMETVKVNNEGMVVDSTLTDAIGKDLSEVVGQSVAEKMMGLEDGDMLEGEDLRIGGEGMKGFYDNMLPRFMDKYGKRWGVKTGTVELPNVEEAGRTMHSVDVTPEMKESVMQGQMLFSTTAAVDALRDDERVYNDLLGKVFSGVSNETRRGIVEDAMRNRGYDFGAATEAWLSGLADDEAFAQLPQEDWRAVKDALGNALRENGVEGEMTDNEARYVLWKAGQIEDGMFSQAKDIVMQDELLGGVVNAADETGVMFSASERRPVALPKASDELMKFEQENPNYITLQEMAEEAEDLYLKGDLDGLAALRDKNREEAKYWEEEVANDLRRGWTKNSKTIRKDRAFAEQSAKVAKHAEDLINDYVKGRDDYSSWGVKEDAEISLDELDELFARHNDDVANSELWDRVLAVSRRLGVDNIKFKKLPKDNVGAAMGGRIRYQADYYNDFTAPDNLKTETLLHEMLHHVTSYAILYPENLTEDQRDAVEKIKGVWEDIKSDPDFKGAYGTTSPGEMVAELSNPDFRDKLKSKTYWERLIDGVLQLFGIERSGANRTTAYDVVRDNVERLLADPNIEAYNKHADTQRQYEVMFSMSPRDRSIARDQYERWMSNSRMQWSEAMQDSMLGLKKLMQAIVGKQYKYIEDIPMNENPYVAENLMSSVTAAEQAAFYTEFMKPLMKAVGKLCKGKKKDRERKRQELTDYLMAKHGLERNLVFADRDAQETAAAGGNYQDAYNENRERDYSGLTALTDESDVHAAEAAAQQIVANYEVQHDVTELWEKINAATQATLEKQYQSGILSKANYEKIRDMFEYYVPLRGWDETTSDEVYGYLTSNAGPFLGGSIVKHAEGRTSKADDPIATISMMADDSIRTGNRNLMKQKFLNFVLNHPSDAVSVNDLWLQYDDVKREWVPVFADIPADATAEEVEQIVAQFEQDMAQLAQQQPDKYKHGRETANIPYRVIPGNEREHQVLVKRRGQTYVLTINGNPRAAQALNGLTNPDVNIEGAWGSIIKGSEWVNRMLSALYTTLSPAFIVSNFLRDSFYSNNMVWVKEKGSWKLSKNYPLRFNYNYYKANPAVLRWLLGKWENGTLDESKPMQKMFKEFMLHGGETGFAMAQDINDYKKKVNKELNGMNGRNYLKKAGSIVAEQYDLLGRSIENCARFAAFMTSRQMGRTVERAAFDAKEISVNFNKKGSGGRMLNQVGQTKAGNWGAFISGLARSVYTFWNAGVQGMANISRATKRNPFKAVAGLFTKWFGYGFFAPMLAAAMGAAAGGDDDDKNAYYNLPEYVRRSNICIWLGDAWLTLPLPIEFRAIYGLGELTYGVWSGNERYNNEELAMQYASQFSQVLPIDMLEGGGGFHPFIPTLLKPYVESEQNVSWSGIPIYKDSPYNQSDPDWTKAFSNTSGWLVASSEWLNAKTGGDEYKKGWLDPNPSKIEYLLKGYLGGLYSFPNDVMKAIQTATGDQEFEWRNIPLANRVIKEGDERLEAKKLRSDYFRYKEEYEETKRLLDKYEKAVKDGNSLYDYAKKLDILNNSKEYAHYEIFKNMDASMAPFREAAGKAEDPEVVKQYEAMELKLMREMVDMINAYDDGKAVDPETAMRKVLMEVLNTANDEALKLEASKELAKSHGAKDGLGGSDTKYNQRYVALRNGTDVDEDAELQKARRNAKDLGNDALYKAYDRALDELATMRKGIHNKKKTVLGLGEGDADSDARIMDKIRTRRREVLDMSDEEVLEKFKPKK